MSTLIVRLLGGLSLSRTSRPLANAHAGVTAGNLPGIHPLPLPPGLRSRSLLAFLVLHQGRFVHRDVLCGTLWGEQGESEARKALRCALWRLRGALEPEDPQRGLYLRVEGDLVGFPGTGSTWVDTSEFAGLLQGLTPDRAGALPEEQARRLGQAVALYRGHLLEGMYDRWVEGERERLRLAFLTGLERLLVHHRVQGQWLAAISTGRELLRADPLREHVHRQLMVCHLSMGNRPSALQQYEGYARLVMTELGVEPMEETRALYLAIRHQGREAVGSEVFV